MRGRPFYGRRRGGAPPGGTRERRRTRARDSGPEPAPQSPLPRMQVQRKEREDPTRQGLCRPSSWYLRGPLLRQGLRGLPSGTCSGCGASSGRETLTSALPPPPQGLSLSSQLSPQTHSSIICLVRPGLALRRPCAGLCPWGGERA